VKYKNNKFAHAFEMITDLYDRPSYNAFDLTPFYAPFYIVFFGLCLGDCGYGILVFLASFFIKKKAKSDFMKSVGNLATYLGLGTMIFGFISGTFFGLTLPEINWFWLQPLKRVMLDSTQLFNLALVLGAIQIAFAMIIKGITTWIRFGFLYSLDNFGWLLMLLGNVAIYALGTGGAITSELQKTLHIAVSSLSGAMMLLFNSPEKGAKGIPGSIGSGLYGIFSKVTGLLGDLLSYIRLFALGISGSVLGSVFNFLASSFAPDVIIVRELVMVVILLFGHSINIFLSGLGAFVHPLRLTFVEFYNNAGFEGGGKAYSPFKKQAE
jgi:V/A-type H+-transporting ATPase subunit I